MPNDRRMRAPGARRFFTVRLSDRGSDLLLREVGALRASLREALAARPFRIEAMVVLPHHLHTVWKLPDGNSDFSGRWRGNKAGLFGAKSRQLFYGALCEMPLISRRM